MNEKDLFIECMNLAKDLDEGIELYKVRQSLPINLLQNLTTPLPVIALKPEVGITLSWKDVGTDLEMLDIIISIIGRGECFLTEVKIFDAPDSMKDFIEWFIKFMYYQESTGNLQVDEVKEVFTSKFCEFPLQDKAVKNKIEVMFI